MADFIKNLDWWIVFGLSAQFVFFLRFVVQWIYSEKAKQSIIPIYFWYISIVGACMILVYAIHIKDPVFIVGQSLALLIYLRNIYFIKKNETVD